MQKFEKDNQLYKSLVNVVGGNKAGHCPFKKGKKKKMNKKMMQSTGTSYQR